MTALYLLTAVICAYGTLLIVLFVTMLQRLSKGNNKMDGKQTIEQCEKNVRNFYKALENFLNALSNHSHQGLPEGSKVTR